MAKPVYRAGASSHPELQRLNPCCDVGDLLELPEPSHLFDPVDCGQGEEDDVSRLTMWEQDVEAVKEDRPKSNRLDLMRAGFSQ